MNISWMDYGLAHKKKMLRWVNVNFRKVNKFKYQKLLIYNEKTIKKRLRKIL